MNFQKPEDLIPRWERFFGFSDFSSQEEDALKRRVVVTGVGMITPVGTDTESTWNGLVSGKSGIGPITQFDDKEIPTQIA